MKSIRTGFFAAVLLAGSMLACADNANAKQRIVLNGTEQTITVAFDSNIIGTGAAETLNIEPGVNVSFTAGAGDRVNLPYGLEHFEITSMGNHIFFSDADANKVVTIIVIGTSIVGFDDGKFVKLEIIFSPGGPPRVQLGGAVVGHVPLDHGEVEYSEGLNDQRLQPENFIYQGAFRLPDSFNWGALGMSFYPPGDGGLGSLLVTGFEAISSPDHPGESCWNPEWNCYAHYGQVSIPEPAVIADWEILPQAILLDGMINFDQGLISDVHREWVWVSGIEYFPKVGTQSVDKIYGSVEFWYSEGVFGDNTFPTVWMADMDGSNARGMFHVGPDEDPYHGRKTGSYLFTAPQWYADHYLGGRQLITGRSRGTPAEYEPVTTHGGSQGPTLFAFHALDSDEPAGDLDALPFLYYRVKFPGCAGPNIGPTEECDYPDFTMCDHWTGGAFVDDGIRRSIMLLGYKGLGTNCYGGAECGDPCFDGQGYHCNPYERQIIFYDVHALGEIALGARDPWTVLPYTVWRPTEFYLPGNVCWNAGGMTFDQANGRLFMVERGLGGDTNAAVIHVWRVTSTP